MTRVEEASASPAWVGSWPGNRARGPTAHHPSGESGAPRAALNSPPMRRAALSRRRQFRFQQPVQVNDHVLHLGIVHRALRPGAPGLFGLAVARKDADDVDGLEVLELERLRIGHPAAHYEMQELFRHGLALRWEPVLSDPIGDCGPAANWPRSCVCDPRSHPSGQVRNPSSLRAERKRSWPKANQSKTYCAAAL